MDVEMGEFSGRLAILCGLPRSGKSTYARRLKEEGWVIVCPDTIRLALHGQQFVLSAEPFIWANAKLMARSLLAEGYKVLVDATNTTKVQRAQWLELAGEFGIEIEAYVMDTLAEECHARNYGTGAVPPEVIDRMADQWEAVEEDGIRVVTEPKLWRM